MSTAAATAATSAAAAATAQTLAGAVRVRVAREVFEALLARASGPVVHVRGLLSQSWWVVHGGFAFHAEGAGVEVPGHLEVIEAKSAW